jgi:hypothetical protein
MCCPFCDDTRRVIEQTCEGEPVQATMRIVEITPDPDLN